MTNKPKISDFKPQDKNANKHSEYGLTLLERSLQENGWMGAITTAADGETFAGSARLEKVGDIMADAEPIVIESDGTRPVIIKRTDIPTATDPRAIRAGIADNRVAEVDLVWDTDQMAEMLEDNEQIFEGLFNDDELVDMGLIEEEHKDAEPQIDRAEELQEKWQVQTGDLWCIGEHRLICGDCTDAAVVERLMDGEKAELMVTDPPYNVDYKGNYIQSGKILSEKEKIWEEKSFNDDIENFAEWLRGIYKVVDEVLSEGCAIYIWHPSGSQAKGFWNAWLMKEWHFQVDIIWNKQSLIISRWDYKPQHEPCMYGWKGKNRSWIGPNNRATVWDYPRQQGASDRAHPTEKPLSMFEACIENHEANIVIDIFNGSGTTLVACENLNRNGRGIEISPKYIAVTLERMSVAFPELLIEKI